MEYLYGNNNNNNNNNNNQQEDQNDQYNNNNYNGYNGNNNNNNQQELFIGPYCGSGSSKEKIEYAVYYDDQCVYKAPEMQVQDVLGGNKLDEGLLEPPKCIPCANSVSSIRCIITIISNTQHALSLKLYSLSLSLSLSFSLTLNTQLEHLQVQQQQQQQQ